MHLPSACGESGSHSAGRTPDQPPLGTSIHVPESQRSAGDARFGLFPNRAPLVAFRSNWIRLVPIELHQGPGFPTFGPMSNLKTASFSIPEKWLPIFPPWTWISNGDWKENRLQHNKLTYALGYMIHVSHAPDRQPQCLSQ